MNLASLAGVVVLVALTVCCGKPSGRDVAVSLDVLRALVSEGAPVERVRDAVDRITAEQSTNTLAARNILLRYLCDSGDEVGALEVLEELDTLHPDASGPEKYADAAHRMADGRLWYNSDLGTLERALLILRHGVRRHPASKPLQDMLRRLDLQWQGAVDRALDPVPMFLLASDRD
jgi:hypothetical protein